MRGIKESKLKRILGLVLFKEFENQMRGFTYINSPIDSLYFDFDVENYIMRMVGDFRLRKSFFQELEKHYVYIQNKED